MNNYYSADDDGDDDASDDAKNSNFFLIKLQVGVHTYSSDKALKLPVDFFQEDSMF